MKGTKAVVSVLIVIAIITSACVNPESKVTNNPPAAANLADSSAADNAHPTESKEKTKDTKDFAVNTVFGDESAQVQAPPLPP